VPVLTYIDSGVLIAAARGEPAIAEVALSFLYDPLREYVTSDFVRIELLPKSIFYGRTEETRFYQTFLLGPRIHRVRISDALIEYALAEGCKTGISGMDAIHIACAVLSGAQELITIEKANKPIHRTKLIKVVSILP
jgi:predicted nucleic acid-binding protein